MSGYIGNIPTPQATQTRDTFTATSGQTSFATSGYTPGFLDVFLNGVHLVNGTDYTASNGSDVVLTSGATTGDSLEVVAYTTFQVVDQSFSGSFSVDSPTFVVDAANNRVGVGTSSPSAPLSVYNASNPYANFADAANYLNVGVITSTYGLINSSLPISFQVSDVERARIDALGSLLVGTTGAQPAAAPLPGNIVSVFSGSSKHGLNITTNTGGTSTLVHFGYSAYGTLGSITTNATTTSYNTSSDYRLKENVVPLTGAADRLAQIPVHRFNFIADADRTVDGFLAHEVQAFVPECVTGEKDQVETVDVTDEDGNVTTETRPVYQGIDQSKLVPLLTAALQEALARIETLEADVAALKGELA